MGEKKEELINMCPLCKKEYPQEDNYCGVDGTQLKVIDLSKANQVSSSILILAMSTELKDRLTHITCARCGGGVYEYSPSTGGLERVVNTLTGCTVFSCYICGRRGWARHGRTSLWTIIMARTVQILIPSLVVLVIAILLLGFLTR